MLDLKKSGRRGLVAFMPVCVFAAAAFFPLLFFSIKTGMLVYSNVVVRPDGLRYSSGNRIEDVAVSLPHVTPWASIGGCGAGGSGSGSDDGIKWIGNGVSGGLIETEILPRYQIGQDFRYFIFAPHFSFKPSYTTVLGLTFPVLSKSAEVQFLGNQDPFDRTTGGMGDISIELSKNFGMSGEYSASVSVSLPTGQYDIKRGSDRAPRFLPAKLQKGSGIYNAGLTVSRIIDVEDGMWFIDATYNFPFNMKPFSRENEMLDKYYSDYKGRLNNSRFYYRFKPYGENDLGAYTPPSVNFAAYYGYRGIENYVHSWGLNFSAPIGVSWISSEYTELYDPRPDPDHLAWSAAFIYGLEFSNPGIPFFMAISLPIHDRMNAPGKDPYDPSPMAAWNYPDWTDFLQQWTFALGIKAAMF